MYTVTLRILVFIFIIFGLADLMVDICINKFTEKEKINLKCKKKKERQFP
jgi:hypothetical protein